MAINDKPLFTPGQSIPADVLEQWLGRAGLGTLDYRQSGDGDGYYAPRTSWYDTEIGKFSPVVSRADRMRQEGNGESTSWVPAGGYDDYISQARNDSTWGANNVADVWDAQGNHLGTSSASADMRNLAALAMMAAGGYGTSLGGTAGQIGNGVLQGSTYGSLAAGISGGDAASGALAGGAAGGITGGINAYGAEQGLSPAATRAASTAANTVLRGGSLQDAARAGLLSGVGSVGSVSVPDGGTDGGVNMDFSTMLDTSGVDFGDNFDNIDTSKLFDNIDWSRAGNFDGSFSAADGGGFDFAKYLKSLFGGGGGGGGGNGGSNMWPLLLGGMLGALDSRNKTTTTTQAPWEPAQPYLKGLLPEGADLYSKYKAQPFSPAQQAGYANMGQILDLVNSNAAGLLGGFQQNASGANQFVRGQPRGLLGSNFQPTADQWRPQNFWDLGVRSKG